MRNWGSETNDPGDNIEASKWLHHFKTLFKNEVAGVSKPENDSQSCSKEEDNHSYFSDLDYKRMR